MSEIHIWKYADLPDCYTKSGVHFIRNRFQEVWGVNRTEVTVNRLRQQINAVAIEDSKIVGWLGVTRDDELVMACVDIKTCNAVYLIRRLLKCLLENVGLPVFAFVPISKLGSAAACLLSGHQCIIYNELFRRNYSNKIILLRKITILQERETATAREQLSKLRLITGERL